MKLKADRYPVIVTEHFDILAAIWILASNDENPEISYLGLHHRLRPAAHIDVRRLIADRGELFRLSIPATRLEKLKLNYRQGKHLPAWLRELPENDRVEAIDRLTVDEFFRSQFRTESESPRSPIEILDWGLNHIDRIRMVEIEKREIRIRKFSTFWIPLFSLMVAIAAIGGSLYLQRQTSADQRALKEYEVSFSPKVDGYTRLMIAISTSFDRASVPGSLGLRQSLNDIDLASIQLEPFLKVDTRDSLKNQIQTFIGFCLEIGGHPPDVRISNKDIDRFINCRNALRATLYDALFQ